MTLEIDYTINPWLNTISIENNKEHLNKLLNLGNEISKLANISINPESSFLQPISEQVNGLTNNLNTTHKDICSVFERNNIITDTIKDKVDTLNTSITQSLSNHYDESKEQYQQLNNVISKLTGDISTSAIKGAIGENFLETVIKNAFPDDTLEVTAKTGHEADMHLISTKFPKILIESKLYKNTVSTAEINKFYSDLGSTGIKYGLFVSLTSNISGHRRLEYKYINDKHVLFIPNSGFENMTIIYGILFLRELITLESKNISNTIIDEKCRLIYSSLSELDKIFENVSKIKNDTLKTKSVIDTQINNLISSSIQTEIIIKDVIHKMKKNITESLSELDCTYTAIEEEHLDILIKDFLETGSKLYASIAETFTIFRDRGYKIHKDEKKSIYNVYNNDTLICELKISKSKATYDFLNSPIKYDFKSTIDLNQFKKILDVL